MYSTTLVRSITHSTRHPRALPSLPTRRSSDLMRRGRGEVEPLHRQLGSAEPRHRPPDQLLVHSRRTAVERTAVEAARSEEHTSELQSHVKIVCRLLLEKKKGREAYRTKWIPWM